MSAFFPLRFTTPINSSPAGHRGVHKRDTRALDNLLYAGYTNILDQYQDPHVGESRRSQCLGGPAFSNFISLGSRSSGSGAVFEARDLTFAR